MSSMAIALLILAVTIVLFIWEPVPIIVTAIGASIAYAYTGIISVDDIFKGYNSTTIVLLAGMMVLGSSLFHTGITDVIGQKMIKITGKSERNIILATLVVSCALSAICSNIGVMTAMAPLVTAMCLAAGFGPSKALLALLFGAQFGGFVTLVGVGSNASAASVMSELGYEPFGFFSITPFGIGVCILGTLYFLLVGTKLLPDTGYIPEFAKTEKKELDKKKAAIAAVTMLCVLVVIAVSPDAVPMHVAATVGALVVVGTKCMSVQDAVKAIDWNCMLLVGSLTAISRNPEQRSRRRGGRYDFKYPGRQPQHLHDYHCDFLCGGNPHSVYVQYSDDSAVPAYRTFHRRVNRRKPLSGGHGGNAGRSRFLRNAVCGASEYDDCGLDEI